MYIGRPAVFHWRFAGNCLENNVGTCFDDGLGPDRFDCSGLIIKGLFDVIGHEAADWPTTVRHVREMWDIAGQTDVVAEAKRGDLLVATSSYLIYSRRHTVPAHVGIVTGNETGIVRWLHASPRKGEVIESPVLRPHAVIGRLALNDLLMFTSVMPQPEKSIKLAL